MHPKHFVAFDLGATSGRTILGTLNDGKVQIREITRFPNSLIRICDKYYWDIHELYSNICDGLRAVSKLGVEITSIGIDTWGVDFAYIGADGAVLSLPRAYRDPYTNGVLSRFFAQMPRRDIYERTGIQIMNFNSVYQLYAARLEQSAAFDDAHSILFMPDALAYMLTGERVCEQTILSTSQLVNARRGTLDDAILRVAGVDKSQFGRAVTAGEIVGVLSREVAGQTGLPQIPVVAVAGHDTASAVVAVPAVNERFAYLSSGTWSLMGVELAAPVINDDTYAMNFTNEGGVDGTTRLLKNITGMWLLEQCREVWSREGREYSYEQIMDLVGATQRSASLIDPDHEMFAAPVDMPSAIRAYCADRNMPKPADDAAMLRLIFDSLAAKYAVVLDKLREVAPFDIECLHVIGGGAQNEILNQMTADAISLPVVAGPAEATAIGNVMMQARAAGVVTSLDDIRRCVRRSIQTKIYKPKTE